MIDFWSFWGCLGSIFARFGGSEGGLGGSFGDLGEPWTPLGGLLGRLGRVLARLRSSWVVKGQERAIRVDWIGDRGRPKGGQDEVKMGPKTDQNRSKKRRRKKKVLKIVLEPSWADLGSSWVPSWGPGNAPNTTPADVS